jgi:hypothetical protein
MKFSFSNGEFYLVLINTSDKCRFSNISIINHDTLTQLIQILITERITNMDGIGLSGFFVGFDELVSEISIIGTYQ